MGQRDQVLAPGDFIPGIWNESEDFGRDPVDWGKHVLQGFNQVEDVESILLEMVDLKHGTSQLPSMR